MNYQHDHTWKKTQSFLPLANRLDENNLPEEYYVPILNMRVHIDHYKVDNPKARVILFHGVGGNGRLLSFIAVPLRKKGYEVICPDLPLYGYTEYEGKVTYDLWVECGIEIVKHFQKDSVPVFLFGLSAGGMLVYQIANECPDVRGIIATCLLDQRNLTVTKKTAINPIMGTIGKPLMAFAHKFAGSLQIPMKFIGKMKAIANNRELALLLMHDKKSSGVRVPLAFVHTMLHPVIKIEPENFTQSPLILVHPGDDRWTDISLSLLFYDRLACKKEVKILEDGGHFPIEKKALIQLENDCIAFLEANR